MFFGTIEEWLGLAIAFPFCVAAGVLSAKLAMLKVKKDR